MYYETATTDRISIDSIITKNVRMKKVKVKAGPRISITYPLELWYLPIKEKENVLSSMVLAGDNGIAIQTPRTRRYNIEYENYIS